MITQQTIEAAYTRRGARDAAARKPPTPPLPLDRCQAYWAGWRSVKPARRRQRTDNLTGRLL